MSSAIRGSDLHKVRLLALHTLLNENPPPEFQFMVANGKLESAVPTKELQFETAGFTFREKFLIITNLTNTSIGLPLAKRNSTKLDMRQGTLIFPFSLMQLKTEAFTYSNVTESILNTVKFILQPCKKTTI